MKIKRAFWHVFYFFNKPKSKSGIVQMLARKYGWIIENYSVVEPADLIGVPHAKD